MDAVLLAFAAAVRVVSGTSSAAATLAAAASASPGCARATSSPVFDDYLTAFGRNYGPYSDEYSRRLEIFHANLEAIREQNGRPDRLWTAGVNHFADRTEEELEYLHGWRSVHTEGNGVGAAGGSAFFETSAEEEEYEAVSLNASIDWRKLGMAKNVPDQGPCGSCWALATSAMLEARYEVSTSGQRMRTFSAQQLVNCVPNPRECGGTGGCKGATVELAMSYITRMGLGSDSDVPYEASVQRCNRPVSSSFLEVGGNAHLHKNEHFGGSAIGLRRWSKLPENKAGPLMHAVQSGPVAISVGATPWHFYQKGVFDGCKRDTIINHAVVLFGYGEENGQKYWTVRNSWGPHWGEAGFIRLKRAETPEADDRHCGVDNKPKEGVACLPYPKSVTVCGMCGMLYDSVSAGFSSQDPSTHSVAQLRGDAGMRRGKASLKSDDWGLF